MLESFNAFEKCVDFDHPQDLLAMFNLFSKSFVVTVTLLRLYC